MTMASLFIMGIPMWKGDNLPKLGWAWTNGFILIAIMCTVLAPVVYCEAPTEWSSFMMIFVASVQAFVVLQVSLVADALSVKKTKVA